MYQWTGSEKYPWCKSNKSLHWIFIPLDRISKRLGVDQKTIRCHLGEMPVLAFSPNADLSQGFTAAQVAEKHGWPEPMVWSQGIKDKDDHERFKALGWGLENLGQVGME